MHLQIRERQIGRVTVLDLAGKLTIDDGAQHLQDKINSHAFQGQLEIVLNLALVSHIDSCGLGQLVASYSSLTKAGGALKLLHVGRRNHDLLSITRLVTVFDTFESEEEALRSFQRAAVGP